MIKKICSLILVGAFCFLISGCNLISTALSAAAAYGLYQVTRK